jgi:hypothetical protein
MNYDTDTQTLRVFFVSGSVYDYKNVPLKVYEEMMNAASKGTFLNQVIKARFGFKKVK